MAGTYNVEGNASGAKKPIDNPDWLKNILVEMDAADKALEQKNYRSGSLVALVALVLFAVLTRFI